MNFDKLFHEINGDEGFVSHVYKDHLGYYTIGHGILVDQRRGGGITEEESEFIVRNRLSKLAIQLTNSIECFSDLSETRQHALINMGYQLGLPGLLGFKKMIAALEEGDFETAYREALDSKWAKLDTPARAERVAAEIRVG